MFPSIATMALGLAVIAALAVADWYVWRTAPMLPYPQAAVSPQDPVEDEADDLKAVA